MLDLNIILKPCFYNGPGVVLIQTTHTLAGRVQIGRRAGPSASLRNRKASAVGSAHTQPSFHRARGDSGVADLGSEPRQSPAGPPEAEVRGAWAWRPPLMLGVFKNYICDRECWS